MAVDVDRVVRVYFVETLAGKMLEHIFLNIRNVENII